MASYADRINRYLERHPGASIAEARGHGKTPERPHLGQDKPQFREYHERRSELERHWNELKELKHGHKARYNAESIASQTSKKSRKELIDAMDYDDLDDYIEDYPEDDDADHYH